MYRAILIDDEQSGINTLQLLIAKYVPEIKIVSATTNPAEGVELIEDYQPDIVFLDIQMPNMNGFELLKRCIYKDFKVIFTTAYEEYAIKALKLNAIDYLLKPIDKNELIDAVNRCISKINEKKTKLLGRDIKELLKEKKEHKLLINSKEKMETILIEDICYLKSDSNYTNIFLINGEKKVVSKTLRDFELQLSELSDKFMRVHQSYLVNLKEILKYVPEASGNLILKNGSVIPVSKSYKEKFINWLSLVV
jgi:two-component system LytT family response regulator